MESKKGGVDFEPEDKKGEENRFQEALNGSAKRKINTQFFWS